MDTKFWTDEWAVIAAAPVLSILLFAIGVCVAWWARNWFENREIAGLRAQISAKDERLQLAHDKQDEANEARDAAVARLHQLQSEVRSGASTKAIAATTSATVSAISTWGQRADELSKILGPEPGEPAHRASFLPWLTGRHSKKDQN